MDLTDGGIYETTEGSSRSAIAVTSANLSLGIYGSDTDQDGIEDFEDIDQNPTETRPDEDGDGIPDELDFNNSEEGPYFVKVDANGEVVPFNADPEYFDCVIDVRNQFMWPRMSMTVSPFYEDPTEKIDNGFNDVELCGQSNWRLPTDSEMLGVREAKLSEDSVFIDSDWAWYRTILQGTDGDDPGVSVPIIHINRTTSVLYYTGGAQSLDLAPVASL